MFFLWVWRKSVDISQLHKGPQVAIIIELAACQLSFRRKRNLWKRLHAEADPQKTLPTWMTQVCKDCASGSCVLRLFNCATVHKIILFMFNFFLTQQPQRRERETPRLEKTTWNRKRRKPKLEPRHVLHLGWRLRSIKTVYIYIYNTFNTNLQPNFLLW